VVAVLAPSTDVLNHRISQARALATARGHGALLLFSAPRRNGGQSAGNVAHFTGYLPLTGTVLMALPVNGRPVVMTDGLNEWRMLSSRVAELAEVKLVGDFGTAVTATLKAYGLGGQISIGTAGASELSLRTWRNIAAALDKGPASLVAVDRDIHRLREEVADHDLELHREASRISDAMIARAFELATEPGTTPARLMAEVEFAGRRLGAEMARLWLAVGPNPQFTSFEFFELAAGIEPGDRVQLGTTVCVEGHYSQGLRMAVLGPPSPALAAAVDRLLLIQDRVAAVMKPGLPAHAVSDLLETMIDESCPYGRDTDPFRFQSCHQLGLDYSDAALATALGASRDKSMDAEGPRLRAGQVIEVHPNYNLPGLGHVCAGDALAVTEDGGEWLTRYPRGLAILGPGKRA
jgi:Xaa-Pro aminopeptidase